MEKRANLWRGVWKNFFTHRKGEHYEKTGLQKTTGGMCQRKSWNCSSGRMWGFCRNDRDKDRSTGEQYIGRCGWAGGRSYNIHAAGRTGGVWYFCATGCGYFRWLYPGNGCIRSSFCGKQRGCVLWLRWKRAGCVWDTCAVRSQLYPPACMEWSVWQERQWLWRRKQWSDDCHETWCACSQIRNEGLHWFSLFRFLGRSEKTACTEGMGRYDSRWKEWCTLWLYDREPWKAVRCRCGCRDGADRKWDQ